MQEIPEELTFDRLLPKDERMVRSYWERGLLSRTIETRSAEEIRNEIRNEQFRNMRKTGKWE